MTEVNVAVVSLIVTIIGLLITAAGTLGPIFIQRQRMRLEQDVESLKRGASDKAVLAVESQTKHATIPIDKVALAVQYADASTPKSVKVESVDVRAAVTRMKQSMPTPPSLPPGALVDLISSAPPARDDQRPTLPRPAPTPKETR